MIRCAEPDAELSCAECRPAHAKADAVGQLPGTRLEFVHGARPSRQSNAKPERANGLDLAYEHYLSAGGIMSANLFCPATACRVIRNVTSLEDVSWASSPRYVNRPQNLGDAKTYGIELEAKFRVNELVWPMPARWVVSSVKMNGSFLRRRWLRSPARTTASTASPPSPAIWASTIALLAYRWRSAATGVDAVVFEVQQTETQRQKLSTGGCSTPMQRGTSHGHEAPVLGVEYRAARFGDADHQLRRQHSPEHAWRGAHLRQLRFAAGSAAVAGCSYWGVSPAYNQCMANTKKTLLLTGASRGIGHATVKHFHAAEWRVITVSRQPFDKICPWPQGRRITFRVTSTMSSTTMPSLPASAPNLLNRRPGVASPRWSTTLAFRPNCRAASAWACLIPISRPGRTFSTSICSPRRSWHVVCSRAEGRAGQRGERHLDCWLQGTPLRWRGLRNIEGRSSPR